MSFILDALRKSETERQRQSGPGLVDAGYRPPAARRAFWLPLLVVILAANLAAIAFIWLRPAGTPPAAPAAEPAPAVPAPAASAAAPAAQAEPAAATPAAAVAAGDSEAAYAATADLPAVEARGGGVTEVLQPPAATGPAPDAPPVRGVIQEGLPSADELIASGAITVPALHLDMHVYAPDPAARFVYINMRKYGEGAVLAEGPRLDEITREGAVLSQNGRRFVLNRD